MVSLTQCLMLDQLSADGWHSVGAPFDIEKTPIGGPSTMMNAKGDVLKVFADGTQVLITMDEWCEIWRKQTIANREKSV